MATEGGLLPGHKLKDSESSTGEVCSIVCHFASPPSVSQRLVEVGSELIDVGWELFVPGGSGIRGVGDSVGEKKAGWMGKYEK